VPDSQAVEQTKVLEGLGAWAVVGGDHEQDRLDLTRPDEHVADQPVMAGHVHEIEVRPVRQPEMGIADVDRHAPPALLGQAIGIDPGQRPQQGRLAVVDVAGRADHDGHRGPAWIRPRRARRSLG